MEEVAKIAEAYYARLPGAQKQMAIDKFKSMDRDGDGTITYYEYISYFGARGSQPDTKFFDLIDKDKNGVLDFKEFLCWHYLGSTGRCLTCDGCGTFLTGLYFSCSLCFPTPETYDLCSCCYQNNQFDHRHSADVFLDNYALLRFYQGKFLGIQHQQQPVNHQLVHHHHHHHHYPQHGQGNNIGVGQMIQAINAGVNVATLCTIM